MDEEALVYAIGKADGNFGGKLMKLGGFTLVHFN
jgi:hypothetical protein